MASDLSTCLRQLKACLDTQHTPHARSIIHRITQLVVEKVDESTAETDFNLECMFTAPNGLMAFLDKSFSSAKHFAKAIDDTFELFRKVIEKYSALFGKRMTIIVPMALRYIQSSSVSARSRELATLVLQDSIAYGCLQTDTYDKLDQLPGELLSVFPQGKLPNRFQQNLYELLGQLAKHFPESVTEPDRIRDILMKAMEKQLLEEDYPSLVSLAGAVRGLDYFLVHFAPSENERELRQRLYVMIKKLSIWEENRSERIVFRNALQVLANHAPLFTLHLYMDHVHWQTMLAGKWIKSTNQDDRQIGINAMYAFHGEIARVLSNPELMAESGRECPSTVDVLNQYVAYYRKLLNSANADQYEIRLAIRGFGIMAGPCQQLAGSSVTLNELLTIVLQRIEGICERSISAVGDMLAFLPDFIQSLSEILTHAKQLTTIQLVSVQTMSVALVRDFYHLPMVHHELIVKSLVCMLENIGKLGGSTRDHLLDSILLQGIVWSCTHTLPFGSLMPPVLSSAASTDDSAQIKSDWKRDFVTYKNYLPLWQGLLVKAQATQDSSLVRAIYRAFMNTLFAIVERLDLSTRKRTFQDDDGQQRELYFCDPNIDLIPIKPRDYHIFLNLVELYRDVLHGSQTPAGVRELFTDWIRPYFERFVKASLERPLVSGFVKLIEMGLSTAATIGYFHLRENSPVDSDVHSIQLVLVYYLEQTIQRALHAVGELQLACLRFVLNAPVRLLLDFIEDETRKQPLMVEVFRTAFLIGRGLLSIARVALYSLQRIVRFRYPPIKASVREQLLQQVLPMVEPFLRTRDSTQPTAQSLRLAKFKRHRTANVAAEKIKRIKQQHRIEQTVDASELVTFQMRILNFLGDLQPNECCWLVVDDLERASDSGWDELDKRSLTRWDADSGRSLELRLLCENGTRPCIKLDGIVGRVCQLAVECSDRATKLTACELLHTIVLYMLGINYQDQLDSLWTHLCQHLLQLSCDTDLAVCQMFEPLLFQIIHFVTQPSKLNQQGTRILFDCLMAGTFNVQHSTIRDLSIRCLREFLQWTNRQSGSAQYSNDRKKINNVLLEQLKTHALESNAPHRYGSALAFNNLFRLLLQHDFHIKRYGFELMHSYAIGLIVTEEQSGFEASQASDAIAEQFLLTLEHLGKMLEHRKALFNQQHNESSENRQLVPPDIGGGDMKDLVRWLFRQCAARQRLYRRKCMQLFARLSKTVRNVTSGEHFLRQHITTDEIKSICLHDDAAQGIGQAPTLPNLLNEQSNSFVVNLYLWLEYLLATLDMYCWLQTETLVKTELLQMLLCWILPTVQCFLRSVVDFSVHEILSHVNSLQLPEIQLSTYEQRTNADKIVRFDTLKSAIVVQIVDLFVLLLSLTGNVEENIPTQMLELWQEQPTINFLLALIFKPHQFGMDSNVSAHHEQEDKRHLVQLEELIVQLVKHCDHRIGQHFVSSLFEKLVTVMEDLGDRMKTLLTLRTIHLADQRSAKGLLLIARQQRTRFDDMHMTNETKTRIEQTARKLLIDCYEAIGQERVCLMLSPSAARFGTIVLEAIFSMSDVIEQKDNDSLVHATISCCLSKDMLHPNIRHGEHFLVCFGSAVYEMFLMKPSECLHVLLQTLDTDNFAYIVRILCDLMDYSYRKQAATKGQLENLLENMVTGWSQLFAYSRQQSNDFGTCDLQMIELMTNIAMICPFPLHEIRHKVGSSYEQWLTELLGNSRSEVSIELKAKVIVLLPTVLGPDSSKEPHWKNFDNALEKLQALHFPLRSTEFPPNSPKRVGFLNCLDRLLDAMIVSRSPLLLKVIVQMTAPDGEGHIAETQIRNAIERFFIDQPYEMQCERLQELWELFANHDYAPTVRETILRRYLCTALWQCRYDTIVEFYIRTIRTISNFTTLDINGRSGWDLEHTLVNLAAGFRLIEHYAALLPKNILTGENFSVALQLYGSANAGEAPVRGKRLIGDFSKRAHSVRRIVCPSKDSTAVELFRKYQCAAYRALVALISNTSDDARMYSVLLFRESRDKGEYLWRHLIDCSNDELYLERGQEQEQTVLTITKRVAIRKEGEHPTSQVAISKDPGLSVVRKSSLSQQVFRFDMNHSIALSAREVAQRDAAELAKRQKGTLSNISFERTKINEHEVMATVCGCIRHMVATKVALDTVVQFLAGSLNDPGQPKNVRLFLAKAIDNCRKELQPHASVLLCPIMQLIVDGCKVRGLSPLLTDLIALVLEWNAVSVAGETKRAGTVVESASLASVLLRLLMNNACQQQGARNTTTKVLRLNLDLIQELISQWHDALIVPAEILFDMISNKQRLQSEERSQLQLIAGLQLGTIVLTKGRGKLVPWMESTKREYLGAILCCLDLPDSTSYKSASLLLGHSLARLYPDGLPEEQNVSDDEHLHTECIAKLSYIQREYDRKFVEILYEIAKGFPSIADPFLSVISHRFPAAAVSEKRMYLELLLGGRLEKFNDELFRELSSMELMLLLRDNELQLSTLHLLNRSLPLVRELQHVQQLIEPVGRVTTEPSTRTECRAVAYEILIYIHERNFSELSVDFQRTLWRYLIQGLCGIQETDTMSTSIRARILEYLTDGGKMPNDLKERFLFLLAELYDPTVEAEFLGSAVALLLDPAIRCRESKDRLFLHEYLNADVKFNEYTIETAARQRHTMTLLTPMFAESSQQRQLQSFITGKGSQMEQLIKATQFCGLDVTASGEGSNHFEPTQDPTKFIKTHETFAMPTQHSLMLEASTLQLDRRSQRTGNIIETTQQERTFERLRKRILKDSAANRQQHTTWAVSRYYSNQRQQAERRRESASQVTLYRRYRLSDFPDLQINLLAFLLPLQALCRRDTACARQIFVAIFNGLVECLVSGDAAGRTVRIVGDEWDRFVGRLNGSLHHILESTKTSDPNLFGGLIELTLGKASGKFTLAPRTIAAVAGSSNMLTMGALYLEAKLADGGDFDSEPVRTVGSITSEAEHWLQLSTLYHALHEHSVMVGIFAEKLDCDPKLREAIELEALGRYKAAHRAYCELIMRVSQARVEERNFCYKSAFNCLVQLGQWDTLLDEIGNQVTNHEQLWSDEWNLENLLPNYMHGNVARVLVGNAAAREFYHILQQWLHIPDRAKHIRTQFGEELTALYISGQEMVRARLFGEQTQRQFLDEWHCAGVLSILVRVDCLLTVRKVIELITYSELLERSTDKLNQAIGGLITSWQNANPALTDSLITWDTIVAYRKFLLTKLETKCSEQENISGNVSTLYRLLYELQLQLVEVAFEQNNIQYAGKLIASLRASESSTGLSKPGKEQTLRRKIAHIRHDRIRQVEASSNITPALLREFRQQMKLNKQLISIENEPDMKRVKRIAWTELFQFADSVRKIIKSSNEDISPEHTTAIEDIIETIMMLPADAMNSEHMTLAEKLTRFSTYCLQRGIDVLVSDIPSSTDRHSNDATLLDLAEAHLHLARYCYDELNPERSETEELPVERLLVTSLLPAIKYGSREARHLFPVLLQLRNLQNNVLCSEFQEHSCTVPSWNYLQWIPQLLSYMKITSDTVETHEASVEGHFLDDLLMRLVQEYPMALYYPARLILSNTVGPIRPIVMQFQDALVFPMLDRFVDELYRVVMPETRLHCMIGALKSQLDSFTEPGAYQTFIDQAVPDVFPTDANDLWRYGQAYRAALPLVDNFRALKHLHPVDERDVILQKLKELNSALQSMRPNSKIKPLPLEDLSPWLADYHCSNIRGQQGESAVEIPGQYCDTDRGTPNPSQHVTILKIMPDVLVFGTLRQPIQITFRSSNGRQYRFLAKFGEDLRQDQRIQQLQREITHRLRSDRHCRAHQLLLRTYEVVPIRSDFGLFGWLEGTVALSEIAKQAAPRYNPGNRGQAHVLEDYGRFLLSTSKVNPMTSESSNTVAYNSPALYGMVAAYGMAEQLRSKFVELSQTIRSCTLKRALYDMAASSESFYRLRMNFAKSLATMNVTCWALGIGDRHLGNIVLERATGILVGVDFGIAFGAGTRDLPVPELVPFRLTPQFVGVMEPMRLAGILQKCHLHTLQCLRDSRMLLRACLEVFIREPTVDWLKAVRQRMVENADNERSSRQNDREWNPQVRVNMVLRKLNGANPKQLLMEELRYGVVAQQREFLVGYLSLVNASASVSTEKVGRAKVLSTELQIEMLLEMAIDGKLLGIMYSGWYPWF